MCQTKPTKHADPLLSGREALPDRNVIKSPASRMHWLHQIAASDQKKLGFESQLWVVKGKAYDLTKYLEKHPGGPDFLRLTQGMDITDLFITHHIDEKKAEAVLAKYYIKDVKHPGANERFTYHEDGLYRRVKRKVAEAFPDSKNTKATFVMKVSSLSVLLGWIGCVAMAVTTGQWRWTLMAGFLLNTLFGIGHNFMHQAPNWGRYLIDLSLFSSYEWTISHCISHHTFSNLELDFEMEALEPFIFSLITKPRNPILFPFYAVFIFGMVGHIEAMVRVYAILKGEQKLRPENLLPVIELAMFVGCLGWPLGYWHFVLMNTVPGLMIAFSTLVVHHSDYAWSEGKHGGVLDFAEHICVTTSDYATTMPFLFSLLFCGLFNNHTIHHLFPTVDESRLPEIKPFVTQACRDLKLTCFEPYRYIDLVYGTFITFTRRDKTTPIFRRPHPSLPKGEKRKSQ